jgi:hypothetical protein
MYEIYRTKTFIDWLDGLADDKAIALINRRLLMLALHGHFGDSKQIAKGIVELRIHFGPGYRSVPDPARQAGHPLALWWRQTFAEARHQEGDRIGRDYGD